MVTTNSRAQMAMDETHIENLALEEALQGREEDKAALKPYRIAFKASDGLVKGLIEKEGLSDGTYRCGAFVITVGGTEAKYIEFERTASRRINIKKSKT